MRVIVPSPLQSYTNKKTSVEAAGATLGDLLADLNLRFPGIRFRMLDEQEQIRPHIKIFVNREQVKSLSTPLGQQDEIVIIAALSGG
jgi:molybdopterin converting factor small subunit